MWHPKKIFGTLSSLPYGENILDGDRFRSAISHKSAIFWNVQIGKKISITQTSKHNTRKHQIKMYSSSCTGTSNNSEACTIGRWAFNATHTTPVVAYIVTLNTVNYWVSGCAARGVLHFTCHTVVTCILVFLARYYFQVFTFTWNVGCHVCDGLPLCVRRFKSWKLSVSLSSVSRPHDSTAVLGGVWNSNDKFGIFDHGGLEKVFQAIATTTDNRKWQNSCF